MKNNNNSVAITFKTINPMYHYLGGENRNRKDGMSHTMKDALNKYKAYLCGEPLKKLSQKNYYLTAQAFLRYIQQQPINQHTLQTYKTHLNNTYQYNTINIHLFGVKRLLRWMGKHTLSDSIKIRPYQETEQHVLTEKEITHILQLSRQKPSDHLITCCLFYGIMRPSETRNIKLQDKHQDILRLHNIKTGNDHRVMDIEWQTAWDTYLQVRPNPQPESINYLFICDKHNFYGKHYTSNYVINETIKKLGEQTNIPFTVTPYTIKRTATTLRFDQDSQFFCGNPKLIKRMGGWKRIQTVMRYDITTDNDIRKYLKQCNKKTQKMQRYQDTIFITPQITSHKSTKGNHSTGFSFSLSFETPQHHYPIPDTPPSGFGNMGVLL